MPVAHALALFMAVAASPVHPGVRLAVARGR
jgi:hypothetical protein